MADTALRTLLAACGSGDLDAEVAEYVLQLANDPDADVDDLGSLLDASHAGFAALPAEARTQLVLNFMLATRSAAPQQGQAGAAEQPGAELLAANLVHALRLEQQVAEPAQAPASRGSSTAASSHGPGPDVAPLLGLCPPDTRPAFLRHMLSARFAGDFQAAADWLLEADVLGQQDAWLDELAEAEAARQAAEQERRQAKRHIVDKFDLRIVSDAAPSSRKGGAPLPDLLPSKQAAPAKVRYRDGQVVSCKGEKFIVEKLGEDWDGGSRGKVFTKGKRGKGFH